MATPMPGDIQTLRNCLLALQDARATRTFTGDGLTDAKIAALSPATVASLITAINALPGFHAADVQPDRMFSSAAIQIASGPMFPMPGVTSPSATKGAGGALAANTYYYVICQVDQDGNWGPKSSEVNATTETTNLTINLAWTIGVGASSFIIFRGTTSGTYTKQQAVTGSTTAAYADAGATFATNVTTQPSATGSAYYGLITDQMVQLATTAGLYSTLYDAVGAQDSPARTTTAPLVAYKHSVPFAAGFI